MLGLDGALSSFKAVQGCQQDVCKMLQGCPQHVFKMCTRCPDLTAKTVARIFYEAYITRFDIITKFYQSLKRDEECDLCIRDWHIVWILVFTLFMIGCFDVSDTQRLRLLIRGSLRVHPVVASRHGFSSFTSEGQCPSSRTSSLCTVIYSTKEIEYWSSVSDPANIIVSLLHGLECPLEIGR